MNKLSSLALLTALALAASRTLAADLSLPAHFSFAPAANSPAPATPVTDASLYSAASGWGFDQGTKQTAAGTPFAFSATLPEGNYKVTVTLGGTADANITVKSESRRLMLEDIKVPANKTRTESFAVNIRRPEISAAGGGGKVGLDSREIGNLNWDEKLTLAFLGDHVAVSQITIEKADIPTLFVLGDSTITDQPGSGGSWAQSLPRWFTADIAISNHAESGETLKAFRRPEERRWDKVVSQLKPGDFVFMAFGTNDSKKSGNNNIYPDEDFSSTYAPADTEFTALLKKYAAETKAKGATPVFVSCMARRTDSMTNGSLLAYAKAAIAAGKDLGCPAIDINSMNLNVNQALGASQVANAYNDGTHPSGYGGYLLSRCIVEGVRQNKLDIAKFIRPDAGTFDPAKPAPLPADYKPAPDLRAASTGGRAGARQGAAPATSTPASPAASPAAPAAQ